MDKEVTEVLERLKQNIQPRDFELTVQVESDLALLSAFLTDPAYAMKPDHIKIEPRIVMPGPDRSDPEIWLQAWLNVASASNSTNMESADAWADHCLVQYKKRFRA